MNDSIKLLAQIFMFQNVLGLYDAELITLQLCFNGHTFLYSWCGPIKLFGMLHCCVEFYSCLILLLFPSCLFYSPSNRKGHLFNHEYNKNNFRNFNKSIGIGLSICVLKVSGYKYRYLS